MQIESTIQISVKDIKRWIAKCNSIHSLQSIRAKTNKRIKSLISPIDESPFKHISVEKKREVLKDLFVDSKQSSNLKESENGR